MSAAEAGFERAKTPIHLWIVGVLALLWTLMGVFDYLATQLELEAYMSQFSEEQLAYFYGFPSWAVSGWALGVWGAFAGAVGLLLRSRWAVWAFAISILGMIVSSIYTLVLTDGATIMGPGAIVFTVIIWIVAIALLLYAWTQAKSGVLT